MYCSIVGEYARLLKRATGISASAITRDFGISGITIRVRSDSSAHVTNYPKILPVSPFDADVTLYHRKESPSGVCVSDVRSLMRIVFP